MTPQEHRARADVLEADAKKEPKSDYAVCLAVAAMKHRREAREIEDGQQEADRCTSVHP
jgi:hypothetical protein